MCMLFWYLLDNIISQSITCAIHVESFMNNFVIKILKLILFSIELCAKRASQILQDLE